MRFSDSMLNKLVAPGISELKRGSVPDLMPRFPHSAHWVEIFLLNTFIGATLVGTTRPVVLNFLRRVESALLEYTDGRRHFNAYTRGSRQAISKYFSAVLHFEHAIAMTYQAAMLMRDFYPGETFFEKGDQTPLQRVNALYNHTKHIDSVLASGQLSDGYAIPLWISNTGLHCSVCSVTFAELADILAVLGANADRLYCPSLNQDKLGR
jgi:hypothetical protein